MNEELSKQWAEIVQINHDVPAIQAADAELMRLREALEWAIGCGHLMATQEAELRRRADAALKGGKG